MHPDTEQAFDRAHATTGEIRAAARRARHAPPPLDADAAKLPPGSPHSARFHRCHARACAAIVPPRLLMCRSHWSMVPIAIRTAVWTNYREGQERRGDPSRAWLRAANAAIAAVALAEGRAVNTISAPLTADDEP